MNEQQQQLIKLLVRNQYPVWEIEAVHKRCCVYFGIEKALEECQGIIDFARLTDIKLLESFRLQVELLEMTMKRADS